MMKTILTVFSYQAGSAAVKTPSVSKVSTVVGFIGANLPTYLIFNGILIFVFAVLLIVCVSILRRARKSEREMLEANDQIFRLLEEQQKRICEITALNAKLQEKQDSLEKATAEQELQIEEIEVLNAELEEGRGALRLSLDASRKAYNDLARQNDVVQSLAQQFNALYYIDMNDFSFVELSTKYDDVRQVIGNKGDSIEGFEQMFRHLVFPEFEQDMRAFCNLDTIQERMQGKTWIAQEFSGPGHGWSEGCFIAADRDENEMLLHVIWGTRNINERKQRQLDYQKDLEQAKERAELASSAKTTFLSNMSHDIRTPMNAILGFTHLIKDHLSDENAILDYVSKIERSGDYLLSIINNVLDMAKIESGNTTLDESIIDLVERDNSVLDIWIDAAAQKKIDFHCTIDVQSRYVWGDASKVEQIMINLISNAIKYTPDGGCIDVRVIELPCEKAGYARIQSIVSDSGIGMSEEFREHVFNSFTRERTTTESKIIGTGLGMAIVKNLVDLMGGTIEVESELGKGTTFTVTNTHRIADEPESLKKAKTSADEDDNVLRGKRILLAEDNELNAEIAAAFLENYGVVVDVAADGVICLDMLNKSESGYYEMILMDIQMPNLDGYMTTKKIRKMSDPVKAAIPIIAMTANAFEEDKRKALEAGMNGHLGKPIDLQKLIAEMLLYLR